MFDLQLSLTNLVIGLLATLFALGILVVFPHEFGHWFSAQCCKIRTTIFSIGFGSPGWRFARIRQTNFYITPWIVGGYVKIPELNPGTSFKSPIWKRLIVTSGGVAMNLFVAWIIVFLLTAIFGEYDMSPTVWKTQPGYPAESAGFLSGDLVVSINGTPVDTSQKVVDTVAKYRNEPLQFTINRNGNTLQIATHTNSGDGKVGLRFLDRVYKPSLLESAQDSLYWEYNILSVTAITAWQAMELPFAKAGYLTLTPAISNSVQAFHGPVGILEAGTAITSHGWYAFIFFVAYLNVAIAAMNMLPIPVLDGGHAILLLLEKIRHKPLSEKAVARWQSTGIVLLACIFGTGMFNDILHPVWHIL